MVNHAEAPDTDFFALRRPKSQGGPQRTSRLKLRPTKVTSPTLDSTWWFNGNPQSKLEKPQNLR